MVTKGIIKSIDLLGNTCTVHIPFFETAGNDPIIETATVSNTPGSYNGYKVGDVVYVAFEDGSMSNPVIIGKLFLGTEKEKADPRGVLNVEESSAAKKATLPADSRLTAEIDSSVPNTTVPYSSLSSIANELNTLNTEVGQMDRDYGNRFKQVISSIDEQGTEFSSTLEQTSKNINARIDTKLDCTNNDAWEYDENGNPILTDEDGNTITHKGFGWDLNNDEWSIKAYDQTVGGNLPKEGLDIFKVTRDSVVINAPNVTLAGYPRVTTVRYAYSDNTVEYPALYNTGVTQSIKDTDINSVWTTGQLEWQDGKHIWQWTQVAKYEYSEENNTWVDTITDTVVCLSGASAASYWLNCSTKTHTGDQQAVITITAMKKVGSEAITEDADAILWYRWGSAGDFVTAATNKHKLAFETANIENKNLEVIAKRNDQEYTRETIVYSPLNTPLLVFSKDSGSLTYDAYGLTKITEGEKATTTASVVLNNTVLTDIAWDIDFDSEDCTVTTVEEVDEHGYKTGLVTLTVTEISPALDIATVTCKATYIDNIGNNKTLSKDFAVAKNRLGKSIYKVDIYNDFVTTPAKEDGTLAISVDVLETVSLHTISCYYGDEPLTITEYVTDNITTNDSSFRIKYTPSTGISLSTNESIVAPNFAISNIAPDVATGSVLYELYRGTTKVAVSKFEISKLVQGTQGIDGAPATSYWVDYNASVHKGSNQQDSITATAWKQRGDADSVRNDSLFIRYGWRQADGAFGNFSEPARGTISVGVSEFIDADLIFELGTCDVTVDDLLVETYSNFDSSKGDSEIITYSPINTPVLDLSNENATLVYKPNGKKFGENVVSSIATVYLDGQKLTDNVTYIWSNGTEGPEIEISSLSNETEEFTCTARVNNQALFKNEVVLSKVFTVSKQIQGVQGENSVSYWLKLSSAIHLGASQQTPLTIVAMQKVGTSLSEDRDESAVLEYSFNGTDWTMVPGRTVGEGESTKTYYDTFNSSTIEGFVFEAKDLLIRATHIGVEYETETISYSPPNTPVLDLDNDTDTILYPANEADDTKGPLGTPVKSKATLYLNGEELEARYDWDLEDCSTIVPTEDLTAVIRVENQQEITVAALFADTARAICTATVTAEGALCGKIYTKAFTVSKTRKGDNAIVYSLVVDHPNIAVDPNDGAINPIILTGTGYMHNGGSTQPLGGATYQYKFDNAVDLISDTTDAFGKFSIPLTQTTGEGDEAVTTTLINNQIEICLLVNDVIVDREIVKVIKDGINGTVGADGVSPIRLDIENDYDSIPCTFDGKILSYDYQEQTTHTLRLFEGTTSVDFKVLDYFPTAGTARYDEDYTGYIIVYELPSNSSLSVTEESMPVVSEPVSSYTAWITKLEDDTAETVYDKAKITYKVYKGTDTTALATANFTVEKRYAGEDGEALVDYYVLAEPTQISYNPNDESYPSGNTVKFSFWRQEGNKSPEELTDGDFAYSLNNGVTKIAIGNDGFIEKEITATTTIKLYTNDSDTAILLDTETISVVSDGRKGSDSTVPGPDGVSIVSQTTYYALIKYKYNDNDGFTAGWIKPPASDTDLEIKAYERYVAEAEEGNRWQGTHNLSEGSQTVKDSWELQPPAHNATTLEEDWKYWTTVRTERTAATATQPKVSYSTPIINEEVSGAYELAQGKTTNYYSASDPSESYTLKKGDCWFKTITSGEEYNSDLGGAQGKLYQWTGGSWEDIGGELVTNKLTANYINALDITTKKITVLGSTDSSILFQADGTKSKAEDRVQIAGFKVHDSTLTVGSTGLDEGGNRVSPNNLIRLNSDGSGNQYNATALTDAEYNNQIEGYTEPDQIPLFVPKTFQRAQSLWSPIDNDNHYLTYYIYNTSFVGSAIMGYAMTKITFTETIDNFKLYLKGTSPDKQSDFVIASTKNSQIIPVWGKAGDRTSVYAQGDTYNKTTAVAVEYGKVEKDSWIYIVYKCGSRNYVQDKGGYVYLPTDVRLTIGDNFQVLADGSVYANNLFLGGTVKDSNINPASGSLSATNSTDTAAGKLAAISAELNHIEVKDTANNVIFKADGRDPSKNDNVQIGGFEVNKNNLFAGSVKDSSYVELSSTPLYTVESVPFEEFKNLLDNDSRTALGNMPAFMGLKEQEERITTQFVQDDGSYMSALATVYVPEADIKSSASEAISSSSLAVAKVTFKHDADLLHIKSFIVDKNATNSLSYAMKNGTYEVVGYNGILEDEVTIPDNCDGIAVTSIAANAFTNCTNITKVTIGKNVTKIGKKAFYGCTVLAELNLPSSITSIEADAFYNTAYYNDNSKWSNNILYIGDYLIKASTDITSCAIGSTIRVISDEAFYNCRNLTSVTFPASNSFIGIGNKAFNGCSRLQTANLSSTYVKIIGDKAFYDCTSLTEVSLPTALSNLGKNVFTGCDLLTTLTVNSTNAFYTASGNVLYKKDATLIHYPARKSDAEFKIPDNIKEIEESAFQGNTYLISITIPNSVTNIGNAAFSGCSSLTSVSGGNNVTTIGSSAFANCESLVSINIPGTVTSINSYAFRNCTSLESIKLGAKVAILGDYVFEGCSSLEEISLPNSLTTIGKWIFKSCSRLKYTVYNNISYLGNDSSKYLYLVGATTVNITTVKIADTCKFIAEDAFKECGKITGKVTVPASVISIGSSALYGCSEITEVVFTQGCQVSTLNVSTFAYCSNLKSITIQPSLNTIAESVFIGCNNLATILFDGSIVNKNISIGMFGNDALKKATWLYTGVSQANYNLRNTPNTSLENISNTNSGHTNFSMERSTGSGAVLNYGTLIVQNPTPGSISLSTITQELNWSRLSNIKKDDTIYFISYKQIISDTDSFSGCFFMEVPDEATLETISRITVSDKFNVFADGSIKATSGELGGFALTESSIHSKNFISSFDDKLLENGQDSSTLEGTYLGTDGFRVGGKFSVDKTGEVVVKAGSISAGDSSWESSTTADDPVYVVTCPEFTVPLIESNVYAIYGSTQDLGNLSFLSYNSLEKPGGEDVQSNPMTVSAETYREKFLVVGVYIKDCVLARFPAKLDAEKYKNKNYAEEHTALDTAVPTYKFSGSAFKSRDPNSAFETDVAAYDYYYFPKKIYNTEAQGISELAKFTAVKRAKIPRAGIYRTSISVRENELIGDIIIYFKDEHCMHRNITSSFRSGLEASFDVFKYNLLKYSQWENNRVAYTAYTLAGSFSESSISDAQYSAPYMERTGGLELNFNSDASAITGPNLYLGINGHISASNIWLKELGEKGVTGLVDYLQSLDRRIKQLENWGTTVGSSASNRGPSLTINDFDIIEDRSAGKHWNAEFSGTSTFTVFYYLDDPGTKLLIIIPASELTDLTSRTINSVVLYFTNVSDNFQLPSMELGMGETDRSGIAADDEDPGIPSMDSQHVSYTGAPNIAKNRLEIPFNNGYCYGGGNLEILIEFTTEGNYRSCYLQPLLTLYYHV